MITQYILFKVLDDGNRQKVAEVHHSRFPPLNGEHGEVIALLGIAHEIGHGLHHTPDERTGLLGGGLYHLQDLVSS